MGIDFIIQFPLMILVSFFTRKLYFPHQRCLFDHFKIEHCQEIDLIFFLLLHYRSLPDSVAKTLDTHKYKLLTKIALDDVEIVKCKYIYVCVMLYFADIF